MTTKAVMPWSVAGRIMSFSKQFETRDSSKEITLYSNDDFPFLNDFFNTTNEETIVVCYVASNVLEGNSYGLNFFLRDNKIDLSDANHWLSIIEKLESRFILKPIEYKILNADLDVRPHVLRAILREDKSALDFLYCKSLVEMSDIVYKDFCNTSRREELSDFKHLRNQLIVRNPHLAKIDKLSTLSTASFFLLLYCIYESRKSWSEETWVNFMVAFDLNASMASEWAVEIFAIDNILFDYQWLEIIQPIRYLDERIAFRLTASFRKEIFYINENQLIKTKK